MTPKKTKKISKDLKKVFFLRDNQIFSGVVVNDLENGTSDVEVQHINSKRIAPFLTNVINSSLREDKMIYSEEFC